MGNRNNLTLSFYTNQSFEVGGTTLSEMEQTMSRKEMLEKAIQSALKGRKALSLNSLPCTCSEITGRIDFKPREPSNYDEIGIDQWTEVQCETTATILYQNNIYEPSVKIEFVAHISNCAVVSIEEPIRAHFDIYPVL